MGSFRELHIAELIANRLRGTITPTEEQELNNWLAEDYSHELILQRLEERYRYGVNININIDIDSHYNSVLRKIDHSKNTFNYKTLLSVAAIVLGGMLLTFSIFNIVSRTTGKSKFYVHGRTIENDSSDAIFKVSGEEIALTKGIDSTYALAGVGVVQSSAGIRLTSLNKMATDSCTVSTRPGKQYEVTLEDNSTVLLNTNSSLTIPSNFSQNRKIIVYGEVYVSVKPNASLPFIIIANGREINVLGTDINIRAYPDELNETTLIKGSILVKSPKGALILQPGNTVTIDGNNTVVSKADLQVVTAWTNGEFLFRNSKIEEVFNEISKWYNLTVVYKNGINNSGKLFTGSLDRSLPLDTLLEVLIESKFAKCSVNGRILNVSPY